MTLDPRTPVVVGVGQSSERLGEPGYRRRSPVDLAADAAREAIRDTGLGAGAGQAAVAAAIDTVAGIRQFENCVARRPRAARPLGQLPAVRGGPRRRQPLRAPFSRSPAARDRSTWSTSSPRPSPHGQAGVVLLFGSEAISTIEHYAKADEEGRPDFTEHAEGSVEDRGYGLKGASSPRHLAAHGLTGAPSQYALIDNARRGRLKQTRGGVRDPMGARLAPFTKVAAANPHASAPVERGAAELVTPTRRTVPSPTPIPATSSPGRRSTRAPPCCSPRWRRRERRGIPEDRWVFLPGDPPARARADGAGRPVEEPGRGHGRQARPRGGRHQGSTTWPPSTCTPASPRRCSRPRGDPRPPPDDLRGLTLTGGLPFFGGAGNNYSMHAIAETVQRARSNPGTFGFVGATAAS